MRAALTGRTSTAGSSRRLLSYFSLATDWCARPSMQCDSIEQPVPSRLSNASLPFSPHCFLHYTAAGELAFTGDVASR
eukprot:4929668-Pleurochrysis_carterae.AAC.1